MGGRTPNEFMSAAGAGGGREDIGNAMFFRACVASNRSAAVPWRSPFPSFLNAYWTSISLFIKYLWFIASIAASADSKSA